MSPGSSQVAIYKMDNQQQSRLLQLPVELQLAIFEYSVIEDTPLLLNCGCDSSYRSVEAWEEDQALWERGEKHPPAQPGLTQTCHVIRATTLPMFYRQNMFRAHYCFETNLDKSIDWLGAIGPANRQNLRDFALWDWNPIFDVFTPRDLKRAKRSDIVRKYGGRMESLHRDDHCFHKVVFGERVEDPLELLPLLFDDSNYPQESGVDDHAAIVPAVSIMCVDGPDSFPNKHRVIRQQPHFTSPEFKAFTNFIHDTNFSDDTNVSTSD